MEKPNKKEANEHCFNCGHSIYEHYFSECKHYRCECAEFVFTQRKCELCDKIVNRNDLSELILNPHIQLIPLCQQHFTTKYVKPHTKGEKIKKNEK